MKSLVIYLIITALVSGCATSPYISSVKPVFPGQAGQSLPAQFAYDSNREYFTKIYNNLEQSIIKRDALAEGFWELAMLFLLDSYVLFDDDIFNVLKEKEKEYSQENAKSIQTSTITMAEENAKSNRDKLNSIIAQNELPFIDLYINLFNFAKQEKNKLMLMEELHNKYSKMVKNDLTNFMAGLTKEQKDQLDKCLKTQDDKCLTNLLTKLGEDKVLLFNYMAQKVKYTQIIRNEFEPRLEKLVKLSKWIEENKVKAEYSLTKQETIRAERAKAITSALLIGLAGGVAAYDSYQSSRSQNIWLNDTKGNVYWGTIR
jgi:hypothetical protein